METDLNVTQRKAIQLLLSGSTVTAAARELGIDRTTIYVWRRSHPHFFCVLNRAQSVQQQSFEGDLQDLAAAALDSVREILTSPQTPVAIRLRAAQTILNLANRPHHQSAPPSVPDEEDAGAVESSLKSSTDASAAPEPPAMTMQRSSTEFNTSVPAFSNKIGRNEPCPCGSTLKFKRCCGNPVTAQHGHRQAAA